MHGAQRNGVEERVSLKRVSDVLSLSLHQALTVSQFQTCFIFGADLVFQLESLLLGKVNASPQQILNVIALSILSLEGIFAWL